MSRLGVRWTIGDVSGDGFRALRLSIAAARRAFGPQTELAVCVNTVPVEEARERVGKLPCEVSWRAAEREDVPEFLRRRLDGGMAEGVGWKFAPLRIFPALHELSLDNDCIVWEAPRANPRMAGRSAPAPSSPPPTCAPASGSSSPCAGQSRSTPASAACPPPSTLGGRSSSSSKSTP